MASKAFRRRFEGLLRSSFQSAAFQQDLFEAINASEALNSSVHIFRGQVGSAVRGPVWVRAVSVAPIMHSGVRHLDLGLNPW